MKDSMLALLIMFWLASLTGVGVAQTDVKTIGTFGEPEVVFDGFQFTEGPADDGHGNLYFTDIPANRIYQIADGKKNVFVEPSSHCNGLMIDGAGQLLACQMDGQLVAYDTATQKSTVLAGAYKGARFNACNDLVVDRRGGVYFTDPHYRAPDPLPQGTTAFYYRANDGTITRLGDDLDAPNGIILSPDEKTLYVVPSQQKQVMSYQIQSPGQISKGRVFFEMEQKQPGGNSGGDGLTVDRAGNLYITTGLGLQVVSPGGKLLGVIELPQQPANVTFGGEDQKILYVTARTGLYQIASPIAGHRFTGSVKSN